MSLATHMSTCDYSSDTPNHGDHDDEAARWSAYRRTWAARRNQQLQRMTDCVAFLQYALITSLIVFNCAPRHSSAVALVAVHTCRRASNLTNKYDLPAHVWTVAGVEQQAIV